MKQCDYTLPAISKELFKCPAYYDIKEDGCVYFDGKKLGSFVEELSVIGKKYYYRKSSGQIIKITHKNFIKPYYENN
jgi:hypothetical protein